MHQGPGVAPFPALFSRSGFSCQSCLSVRKPTQSFHGFPLFSSLSISVHRCHPLRCVSVFHSSDFSHSGYRDNERNIGISGWLVLVYLSMVCTVRMTLQLPLWMCVTWDRDLVICSDWGCNDIINITIAKLSRYYCGRYEMIGLPGKKCRF